MTPDHPKVRRDEDGHLWLNFGEYGQTVEVAAISGDGRRVLTVREVGVARVWDIDTGEPVGEVHPVSPLEGTNARGGSFQTYIESAVLDTSGDVAILGLNDGRIVAFDVRSGEQQHVWHEPGCKTREFGIVRALALSPDGSLVVAGFWNRSSGVWRVADGERIAWLSPEHGSDSVKAEVWGRHELVSSVAVSSDNRYVFTGCADMTAVLWDLDTEKPVRVATEHAEDVLDIALVHDGAGLRVRWITSGGTIWMARPNGDDATRLVTTNHHWDRALWMPDGATAIARESGDRCYKLIDLGGTCTDMGRAPRGLLDQAWYLAATSSDGRVLALPRTHDELEVVSGNHPTTIKGEKDFNSCRLSPCGRWLATGLFPNGETTLWRVADGARILDLPQGSVAFSNDGSRLALGTWDNRGKSKTCPVLIFDLRPDQPPRRAGALAGHTGSTMGLAFVGSDGFVTVSLDQTVRWWSLHTRRRFWSRLPGCELACHRIEGAGRVVAVLDDRRVLLDRANGLEVWSQEGCLHRFDTGHPYDSPIAVDTTRRYCAVATMRGRVAVCDMEEITETLVAPTIEQPDVVPTRADVGHRRPLARAAAWFWPGGPYVHQSDGPRGWITPIRIANGAVVIPCANEAVALQIEQTETGKGGTIGTVPFDGRLRASVVTADRIVVVGDDGRVVAAPVSWH